MRTLSAEEESLQRLQKLNELIDKLIHLALKGGTLDKRRSDIPLNEPTPHKRRCWEIKDCRQPDCLCRKGDDYRCWLISGTLSKGCCQGLFAQKYNSCYKCEVFNQFLDTPENTLYEKVNILITHLADQCQRERELAFKDGLTGLYNRNFLNLIEKGEVLNPNHMAFPISIIIFDLDTLKWVNDTYGHLMGDQVIRELSTFLMENKREPDLLFRLGGDEFMLMMSGVDEKRRVLTEKRLIDLSSIWNQKRRHSIPVPLMFSLGGATGFGGQKINQIIIEADKKMYIHKQSKRSEAFSTTYCANSAFLIPTESVESIVS